MPFSFLNPWFWLGALAVAAPIWLHLRRKRQTNLIFFSAVQFLADKPEPQAAPLRLKDLVLFALRTLALLLVIGAFAWPYLAGPDTLAIRESRVYILDNTMSRQANGSFETDRERVASEVSKAGPNIQTAVIELTSAPRVLVQLGEERSAAVARIKALQPSHQRGSYLAAFRQASTVLANSLGEQKRIFFFGDNQENQWTESVSTPAFLRDISLDLPKTSATVLPNLALSEPRVQRVFLGEKSLVHFSAKLNQTGRVGKPTVVIHANGQTVLSRAVEMENQPGTILLQAQWEADPGVWLRGDVALEGAPDSLTPDDRVFFTLAPVTEGRVAILANSAFLRLALSPEIMRGEWAARLLDPSKLGAELARNEDAEVLCIESNFLQSGDARKLVSRYLTNGKGVFLMVNRTTPAIKGCLRELGFEAEPVSGSNEKLQFVFSNHPIFHPFLSPDYGNLTEITFKPRVRLSAPEAAPLAFSGSGASLLFQSSRFPGKLYVAAFGLDRDQTSWPVHQTFIPFLDLMLQSARPEDPMPTSFEPGEMVSVPVPQPVTAGRELVLRRDQQELSRVPVEGAKAQIRLPDAPGLYTIAFNDGAAAERVVSVNPSPKESALTYVETPDVVNTWQVRTGVSPMKTTATITAGVSISAILQQRWWWWMLLGGFCLLMLEVLLAETRRASQ